MPADLPRLRVGDWGHAASLIQRLARDVNPLVPQARVYNNAALTLTTGTVATLTFNTERFDSGSLHSTSSNTGRLTAPVTGLYMAGAHVSFASNATGIRLLRVRLNGSTVIGTQLMPAVSGDSTVVSVSTLYQLTAGDYVEAQAYQTSGGNLNVEASGNFSPEFWMVRLGGFVNQGV